MHTKWAFGGVIIGILSACACGKDKLAAAGSGTTSNGSAIVTPAVSASPTKRKLRVALFPYIPDANHDHYKALLDFIAKKFASLNKNVELELRPLDPDNADEPFYTPATVQKWLTSTSGEGYDVIEVDMEMLDQLVGDGGSNAVAQPWDMKVSDDWHPAAAAAVQLGGRIWAYPHMLCGHFVVTRDEKISKAANESALVAAVGAAKPSRLVGDFGGSWNLPSLFLDSYADSHTAADVAKGIAPALDASALRDLTAVAHLCEPAPSKQCTDDFHNDMKPAVAAFATKSVAAYLGYSEGLHDILETRKDSDPLFITSAPLGGGSHPVLFADGLVLRKDCTGDCKADARAFAELLTGADVSEELLMSGDAPNGKPRYLLPASKRAFHIPKVAADSYYKLLESEIKDGGPFPNRDLVANKAAMKKAILASIQAK